MRNHQHGERGVAGSTPMRSHQRGELGVATIVCLRRSHRFCGLLFAPQVLGVTAARGACRGSPMSTNTRMSMRCCATECMNDGPLAPVPRARRPCSSTYELVTCSLT